MNDILEHKHQHEHGQHEPHDEIQLLTDKDQVNFLLAQRIYLMYKQQVIFLTLNPKNTRLLISALNIERLNVPLQMESGLIVMNITADHIKAVCANGEYSLHLRRRKHAVGDAAFSAYMKNNRTGRRLATCFLMRVEYDEEKWIKHYGHPLLMMNATLAHGPSTSTTTSTTTTCTTNTMSSSYSSTEDLELMASAAAANALAASDESIVERDESGHIIRSLHVSGACNQYNNNNNNNKDESKKKNEDKKSSEQQQQQKDQQKTKKKKSIHHKIRSARKRLINRGKALLNPYHSRSVVDDNDDCASRLSRVVQVR